MGRCAKCGAEMIQKIIDSLRRKIALIIGRGVVTGVDDTGKIQKLQIAGLTDEAHDGVERMQQFGFTGVPPVGSECIPVFIGGSREHGVVVACDDRGSRPTGMESGESKMYNSQGDYIYIDKSGRIFIKSSNKVIVDSPSIKLGSYSANVALMMSTYADALETQIGLIVTALNSVIGTATGVPGTVPEFVRPTGSITTKTMAQ
jgi:phage baseplate assembly protein V